MSGGLSNSLHTWAHLLMRTNMKKLNFFARERGYSMSQINTLFRLHHRGSMGISDISSDTGVSPAATSQLIDKLVQLELVQRVEDPHDRRNKIVDLTPDGHALVEQSKQELGEWINQLTSSFTPEEEEMVNRSIQLLINKTLELEDKEQSL